MPGPSSSGGDSAPDRGLSRQQRLLRPSHFAEAYEGGRKYAGRYMVLWLRTAKDADRRLGVVSSRRVGGAVQRNRARRRLRALFRQEREHLSGREDLILVARASCVAAPWTELVQDFQALARRAGLCPSPPAPPSP